jgi:hypothetical protein
VIFQEAENRLHAQKAIMVRLMKTPVAEAVGVEEMVHA